MNRIMRAAAFTLALFISVASAMAQGTQSAAMGELNSLTEKVKDADTRVRVAAFHEVWSIALASDNSEVKMLALDLLREPVGSSSDQIRLPAVYAIAEVANSTADLKVKSKALADLSAPMVSGQLPIRLAAIDAVNSIVLPAPAPELALQAVELLGEPLRSGNNGVRIPAINAVAHIALASNDPRVYGAVLDLLQAPLQSNAAIGGMEVRTMAVAEVEKIGVASTDTAIKTKAMQTLQACANNSQWEPESQHRAAEGAARIQSTIKPAAPATSAATSGKLSVSSTPTGADIELDGSFVGNTPSELSIAEGDHTIQIKKAGFTLWERKLKITAGSTVHIDAELQKTP